MSTPTAAAHPARPRHGGGRTYGDLVRTMVVFAAILGVIALFYPPTARHPRQPAVDYLPAVAVLARQVSFPVLVPGGLPAGWTANHVRATVGPDGRTGAVDLGFYVSGAAGGGASGAYVALEESNAPAAAFLRDQHVAGPVRARLRLDGRVFAVRAAGGHPALVAALPGGATLVVDGEAPLGLLERLAVALRPAA